jgi:chromosome segregation ATPase
MTTGNENNSGSRLDRIEEILAATATQTALNAQAIASNARAMEANSSGLTETRAIVESNARAIESNSSSLAETRAIVESNARAIEANSNTMRENDARTAARFTEVAEAIDSLREVVLNFVDGIQVMNQRIDNQEDRYTEIVGQVRDLQVQNSRILDRLEGLEGQGGQG